MPSQVGMLLRETVSQLGRTRSLDLQVAREARARCGTAGLRRPGLHADSAAGRWIARAYPHWLLAHDSLLAVVGIPEIRPETAIPETPLASRDHARYKARQRARGAWW